MREEDPEQIEQQVEEEAKDRPEQEKTKTNDIVDIRDVDAHWLKRKLSEAMPDVSPEEILNIESRILGVLENLESSARDCEKKLFAILSLKRIELIRKIVKSRHAIFFGVLLKQAQS